MNFCYTPYFNNDKICEPLPVQGDIVGFVNIIAILFVLYIVTTNTVFVKANQRVFWMMILLK